MKTLLIAGLAAASLSGFVGTASAAGHAKSCDDKTIAMVMADVEKAPADKKEMAMTAFNMANENMAAGMADDCSEQLTKAAELSKG